MPTLDDVKAVLKGADKGEELVEVLSNLLHETDSTKKSLSTLTATHNRFLSELKPLGFGGGDTTAAMSFIGDLKGKIESLKDAESQLTEKEKRVSGSTAEIQRLEKAMKELQSQWNAASDKASKAETALRNRQIKDSLVPKMKDRIFSADLRAERLIESGRVTYDEAGRVVFKDGDNVLDVDKGLEMYFNDASNKDDLKNTQAVGSGTSARRNPEKVKSMAEFTKMDAAKQHEFIKSGGELTE